MDVYSELDAWLLSAQQVLRRHVDYAARYTLCTDRPGPEFLELVASTAMATLMLQMSVGTSGVPADHWELIQRAAGQRLREMRIWYRSYAPTPPIIAVCSEICVQLLAAEWPAITRTVATWRTVGRMTVDELEQHLITERNQCMSANRTAAPAPPRPSCLKRIAQALVLAHVQGCAVASWVVMTRTGWVGAFAVGDDATRTSLAFEPHLGASITRPLEQVTSVHLTIIDPPLPRGGAILRRRASCAPRAPARGTDRYDRRSDGTRRSHHDLNARPLDALADTVERPVSDDVLTVTPTE